MRGGKPSATGGSANNAHDAVATMEIIIKPSTCNDLWALSLVRVVNNRSTAVRLTAGLLAILTLSRVRGTESDRGTTRKPPHPLPFATESYRDSRRNEIRSCGNFRDI